MANVGSFSLIRSTLAGSAAGIFAFIYIYIYVYTYTHLYSPCARIS